MGEDDLLYTLALQHVPNIGDILAKRLIAHCGTAKAVMQSKKETLLKIDGIGTHTLRNFFDVTHLKAAENEIAFIADNAIKVSYFKDEKYPVALKHCIDSPVLLFETGTINVTESPVISIVGTRKITNSGVAFCERLVEVLKPYNPVIVSGFAYGTDISAHKKYMAAVEANGGCLTDFWSSDTFDRNNFLKRNRVIAGLSEATIVIESAEKGGSLVTADIAHSYNRDVFAVPGRPTDKLSTGCNNLIKSQKAHMLTNPLDVPYMLNWQLEKASKPAVQKQLFVELDATEKVIYNYLKTEHKQQLDVIALHCKIPIFKVSSTLLNMELKGVIRPLPGKLFEVV